MVQKFNIPVVFRVKAESEEEAKKLVDCLICHGFKQVREHEPKAWAAIKRWTWAAIRGVKRDEY
jgi:hypothetical protein